MVKLCIVGALTSSMSMYSYRLWDFDKVEHIDPTDANGSMIVLYNIGNEVYRIGPISSLRNSEWCTDKIRNLMDIVHAVRNSCVLLYNQYISSWSSVLFSVISIVCLLKIFMLFLTILYNCVFVYDKYVNCINLVNLSTLIKLLDCKLINIFKYLLQSNMLLFIQSFKYLKLNTYNNINILIVSSFVLYEFLYIFLFLMYKSSKVYILGCVNSIYIPIKNSGIGIISFIYFLLGYNYVNMNDVVSVYKVVHMCNFGLVVNYSMYSFIICMSLLHKLSLTVYLIKSFFIYKMINTLFFLYMTYQAATLLTFTMLYSTFIVELKYLCIFLFTSSLGIVGTYFNLDNFYLPLYNNTYQISFSPFVYAIKGSIVIPLYGWLECKLFHYNYYGMLDISQSVINISSMCDIKIVTTILSLLLKYINKIIKNIVTYLDVSSYNINIINYLVESFINNYIMLKNSIINNIFYTICYHNIVLFNIILLYVSSFVSFYNLILYFYKLYSYIYIYIDEFTYFITGSLCNVSNFLKMYIDIRHNESYNLY